jgi:hypothetical protein
MIEVLYIIENYREQRVHDNQMIAKLFAVSFDFAFLIRLVYYSFISSVHVSIHI